MRDLKISAVLLVVLVLLLAGCGSTQADQGTGSRDAPQTTATGEETPDLRTVVINASGGKKVEVRVEVADNLAEQEKGLMYRTALGEDRGMLFIYPDERPLSYWMRNTLIPLSIAYIDSKGRITDILDMKPLDDTAPHYNSSEPAQYALEVNQGFFDERGVKVGDHADLPR